MVNHIDYDAPLNQTMSIIGRHMSTKQYEVTLCIARVPTHREASMNTRTMNTIVRR
jgi:hypothetical protein